jgi:BirA family transcriptional regulator, biotin operon repressor / biotin---[acetyl-CoA-carboxylase] ligase
MDTSNSSLTGLQNLVTQLKSLLAESSITDIEVLDSIDSTNSALMQRRFFDRPRPDALLWALRQTSGRGRRGRVWQSHSEHALTFSLSFESEIRQDSKLASLSPAAGLHLAIALSQMIPGVQVKWPNDLWRARRKIAGILLEATQRGKVQRVVIGIGINLYWPSTQMLHALSLSEDSAQTSPAVTSSSLAPHSVTPQTPGGLFEHAVSIEKKLAVLACCAKAMAALHQDAQSKSVQSSGWFNKWSSHDALEGQRVDLFQDQTLIASGINAGVDHDGAFLLRALSMSSEHAKPCEPTDKQPIGNDVQRFEIGEVSLRGATIPNNT